METQIAKGTEKSSNGHKINNQHKNNQSNDKFQNSTSYQSTAENGDSRRRKAPKLTQVENLEHENNNVCSRIPDETLLSRLPCYKKLHHKMGCKVFIFLLMLVLDVVDLASDWLVYHDVAITERGLVYGPPGDAIRYALLAFSIIGSITFVCEVTNLWWEIFRNNAWVDSDLLSAITIWIEDVPQIILNVIIVACREDAISYFQLVKASVIIASCIIRIIVTLVKYCSKRARCDLEYASRNMESCRHVTYRVFIMLGLILIFAGSIAVFLFTQSGRNPDGSITFHIPHNLVKGEYDDQKYFQNVSIYLSHPLLDYNHTGTLATADVNWLRIVTINDIRKQDANGIFKLEYDDSTSSKLIISHCNKTGVMQVQECLQINRAAKTLTISQPCTTSYISKPRSAFIFKFHFEKAKMPGLVFGDIKFNTKVHTAGKCQSPSSQIYDAVGERIKDVASEANAALHYFRTKDGISGTNAVIHNVGNSGSFYHKDNLTDIEDVWETGFAYCKSSGSLAPHLDNDVDVQCT